MSPELVELWEKEMAFTEAQKGGMLKFRAALIAEGLLHEAYDNTPSFFRFMQARKWNVADATKMFRDHMIWRKQNDMDIWVPTAQGPIPKFLLEFRFPELEKVKAAYSFVHHKMGKDGKPVYFDRLGAINYSEMIKTSSTERVLKYFNWYAEASQQWRLPAPRRRRFGAHRRRGL